MSKTEQLNLQIKGIHCAGCVATIEQGVKKLPGVKDSIVNLVTATASVAYDPNQTSSASIIKTIEQLGYGAEEGTEELFASVAEEVQTSKKRFLWALAFAVPVVLLAMLPMLFGSMPLLWNGTLQLVGTFFVLFI